MLYFNKQQKTICIVVTAINGKIMLLHCLYISVPYIVNEAGKPGSLPYANIEKSKCYSQNFRFAPFSSLGQESVKTEL
jgi:hypothetical protein